MDTPDERHTPFLLFIILICEQAHPEPPTQGELWDVVEGIIDNVDLGGVFESYSSSKGGARSKGAPLKFRVDVQKLLRDELVGVKGSRLALTDRGREGIPKPETDPALVLVEHHIRAAN